MTGEVAWKGAMLLAAGAVVHLPWGGEGHARPFPPVSPLKNPKWQQGADLMRPRW